MRYNNEYESHREWVIRMLEEIAETFTVEHKEDIEHIEALNYTIGYLNWNWLDG